jgi:hypothetical protein
MSKADTLVDRREFIVAAGATAAAAALPVAIVSASPALGAQAAAATLADWSIDDMWGVYPRPSEAIGFGRPRGDGELTAAVHPSDWQFVA